MAEEFNPYTRIPEDTFEKLQINAGILVDSCTWSADGTVTVGNILGATSGGVKFKASQEFKDMAEGIDNAPKNMKELMKAGAWDVTLSGTFKSVDAALVAKLIGTADVESVKVIPRAKLKDTDFTDLYWVGDYGDKGGALIIHIINALSTGGIEINSADDDNGDIPFEFKGHYSIESQTTVPFEVGVVTAAKAA